MIIYVNREASTSSDNDSPRASGSSRPFTSNSKDLRHADTFSATAEQKRRQPTLRHTASMSTVSAPRMLSSLVCSIILAPLTSYCSRTTA